MTIFEALYNIEETEKNKKKKEKNMEQQYDDELEIDLKELFFALLQKWKYIVFSAVFVGGITALVNLYVLVPQYASTAKLYILSKSTSLTSLADLQVGTSLTQDYMVVINSRPVAEKVISNLNLKMEYEDLISKVTVENPADTRILNITVQDEKAETAKKIADEFAEVSADYIAKKMDQDPPTIIETGFADEKPVSPHKTKNTLLGVIIGGFLAAAVVVVAYLMDDSIKTEEDIEKYIGINTLAAVPESSDPMADQLDKKRKKKRPIRKVRK